MENENIRYFQWLLSEKRGQILVFDKIEADGEDVYITFKDKSRINEKFVAQLNQKDLTGKLMAEIDHPNNCWQFKEEIVGEETGKMSEDTDSEGRRYEIPSVSEIASDGKKGPKKTKITHFIPPRPTPPRTSNFGVISTPPPLPQQMVQEETKISINANDPVYILLSKAKKVQREITMNMEIALPAKNLYDIAKESFDRGDEKFIEFIVNDITVEEIKNALKNALRDMYEESISNPV